MWGLIAPLLAIGGGAYLATQANQRAVNTINPAVAQVQATDNAIAQSGGVGPGATYLRTMVANPQTLTPVQQENLAEMRRANINEIRGSGFAGSGRTASELFKKTDADYINGALQQNKTNAINAADKLQGTSTSAAMAGANAGLQGAEIDANADIATGKIYGQALGDVSSLINRQNKLSTLT